ncbi:hypothetical protein ABW19_dt0204127 [Dactylella cylindrospora]|nr:hypothetical protein ABW19_dt0204127 [Dactylella cylindrospora]
MRSFNTMIALLAALLLLPGQTLAAYWKGFSMGANTATGACKSRGDWEADFAAIKSWNKGFNAARLYASSDCNTLANAVPAAQKYGFKLLVGVWATDGAHFGREKAALEAAIRQYGTGWIAAISVGSEDLYRKDISPQQLANQIYDVRGMVRQWNNKLLVGHTDTWTAWVDGANDVVTRACDIVITNGFPYWQGATIARAKRVYQESVWATQGHVAAVKPGIKVWIGETGWPSVGDNFGASVPSRPNAQKYYDAVACWIFPKANAFWFTAFDAPAAQPKVEQGFGVAYYTRKLKIKLTC